MQFPNLTALLRGKGSTSLVPVTSAPVEITKAQGASSPQRQLKSEVRSRIIPQSTPPKRGTADFLKAYGELPWMRAVVEKIAYSEASVRWTVKGVVDKKTKGWQRRPPVALIKGKKARMKALEQEDVETFEDHPLVALLSDPNPIFTALDVAMLNRTFIEIVGESFMVMERLAGGLPTIFWPIPPHWCQHVPDERDPTFRFQNERFRLTVPMEDVLWDRSLNPFQPYGHGSGLMMTLEDELSAYEHGSKTVNYQFYNRNRPDWIISMEGATDTQTQAMTDNWRGAFQGMRQMFRTFITNSKLKAEKLQVDFVHSQLLELLAAMRDTTRMVPGVPPEILGITESSNKATITAARAIYGEQVIEPRLERKREFLQKHLVPLFDSSILLDYESPVPEDEDFQLRALSSGKVPYRVNEGRKIAKLDPIPDEEGGRLWCVASGVSFKEKLEESTPPALMPFTGQSAPGSAPGAPGGPPKPGESNPPKPPGGASADEPKELTPGETRNDSTAPTDAAPEKKELLALRPTRAGESPATKASEVMLALGLVSRKPS